MWLLCYSDKMLCASWEGSFSVILCKPRFYGIYWMVETKLTGVTLAHGRVQLDAEGTYQCSLTGLIFEVTEAVKITYSLLSWSKYANLVEKPWIVGGPLFDVRCDSARALTSIQFPHSLCLGGEWGATGPAGAGGCRLPGHRRR